MPRDLHAKAGHKVARRYSEFERLHDELARAWGKQVELPRLPPKRLTYFGGAPSELQIEERRLRLEEYLQQLVRQLNWSRDEALRAFLECDGWLKPRKPKAKKEPGASAAAAAGGAPGSP